MTKCSSKEEPKIKNLETINNSKINDKINEILNIHDDDDNINDLNTNDDKISKIKTINKRKRSYNEVDKSNTNNKFMENKNNNKFDDFKLNNDTDQDINNNSDIIIISENLNDVNNDNKQNKYDDVNDIIENSDIAVTIDNKPSNYNMNNDNNANNEIDPFTFDDTDPNNQDINQEFYEYFQNNHVGKQDYSIKNLPQTKLKYFEHINNNNFFTNNKYINFNKDNTDNEDPIIFERKFDENNNLNEDLDISFSDGNMDELDFSYNQNSILLNLNLLEPTSFRIG